MSIDAASNTTPSPLTEIEGAYEHALAALDDRHRGRNLRRFADQFIERIARPESEHASSLLQQVQLPV